MIVYFDTSALIKKYFHEPYTDNILELWRNTDYRITSMVTFAESLATAHRKIRDQLLSDTVRHKLIDRIKTDWKMFVRVDVNTELNAEIERITATYSLRGFDAIHLASATLIQKSVKQPLIFACFDKALLKAAKAEDLIPFPEEY